MYLSFLLVCFLICVNLRLVHSHENSSGYYRTSVYFLAKLFADLLPNRMIPIFLFTTIAYYMMGNICKHTNTNKKQNFFIIFITRKKYLPHLLPSDLL